MLAVPPAFSSWVGYNTPLYLNSAFRDISNLAHDKNPTFTISHDYKSKIYNNMHAGVPLISPEPIPPATKSSLITATATYTCRFCCKKFTSRSNMSVHERVHTRERPYNCTFCSRAFSQHGQLVIHERSHTGHRPYSCSHCSKTFTSNKVLKIHVRTHTGEKPYRCEHCSKPFAAYANLVVHRRIHTRERPYQCIYCGRSFEHSGNLQRHVKIHTRHRTLCADEEVFGKCKDITGKKHTKSSFQCKNTVNVKANRVKALKFLEQSFGAPLRLDNDGVHGNGVEIGPQSPAYQMSPQIVDNRKLPVSLPATQFEDLYGIQYYFPANKESKLYHFLDYDSMITSESIKGSRRNSWHSNCDGGFITMTDVFSKEMVENPRVRIEPDGSISNCCRTSEEPTDLSVSSPNSDDTINENFSRFGNFREEISVNAITNRSMDGRNVMRPNPVSGKSTSPKSLWINSYLSSHETANNRETIGKSESLISGRRVDDDGANAVTSHFDDQYIITQNKIPSGELADRSQNQDQSPEQDSHVLLAIGASTTPNTPSIKHIGFYDSSASSSDLFARGNCHRYSDEQVTSALPVLNETRYNSRPDTHQQVDYPLPQIFAQDLSIDHSQKQSNVDSHLQTLSHDPLAMAMTR